MTRLPELTVVIPTRNRPSLLLAAVRAALAQRDVDTEVIVVDDCSRHGPPDLRSMLSDRRLRVLSHARHMGVSAARNTGIRAARARWIAFLDDDDLWSPVKARRLLDAAAVAEADFAYSAAFVTGPDGRVLQLVPAPSPVGLDRELLVRNAIPGGCSNVIARSDLVRSLGGFDERLAVLADWDLWIRLALAGTGAACDEPLVAYRRHPQSMVSRAEHDVVAELAYLERKHGAVGRALGVEFDRRRLYRYLARAHRKAGRRVQAARMYARLALLDRSAGDACRAAAVLLGVRHWVDHRPAERLPAMPDWLESPLGEPAAPGQGQAALPQGGAGHAA